MPLLDNPSRLKCVPCTQNLLSGEVTVARSSFKKHIISDTHKRACRNQLGGSEDGEQSRINHADDRSPVPPSNGRLPQPFELVPSTISANIPSPSHDFGASDHWPPEGDNEVFGDTLYYDGIYHDVVGNPIQFSAGAGSSKNVQREELLNRQMDTYGILNAEEDGRRFHRGVDLEELLGDDVDDATKTNVERLNPDYDSGKTYKSDRNLPLKSVLQISKTTRLNSSCKVRVCVEREVQMRHGSHTARRRRASLFFAIRNVAMSLQLILTELSAGHA